MALQHPFASVAPTVLWANPAIRVSCLTNLESCPFWGYSVLFFKKTKQNPTTKVQQKCIQNPAFSLAGLSRQPSHYLHACAALNCPVSRSTPRSKGWHSLSLTLGCRQAPAHQRPHLSQASSSSPEKPVWSLSLYPSQRPVQAASLREGKKASPLALFLDPPDLSALPLPRELL